MRGHLHFINEKLLYVILSLICRYWRQKDRDAWSRWLRSLYVEGDRLAGFHGGPHLKTPGAGFLCPAESHPGHVAMTYTALAALRLIEGKDACLEGLDAEKLAAGVRALQLRAEDIDCPIMKKFDGCFASSLEGPEYDMRFVYCAAAVCKLIDDWSGMDKDRSGLK